MKITLLFFAITLLIVNISYSQESPTGKDFSVLILSSSYLPGLSTLDATFRQKMELEGYTLNVYGANYVDVVNNRVDLNEFNMICMFFPPHPNTEQVEPFLKSAPAIFDFVKKGGGLFIFTDENSNEYISLSKFLTPVGASILPETVVDPGRIFRQKGYHLEYFCSTDNIAPHPITRGVTSLVYPLAYSTEESRATITMDLDDTWDVVIRGTKSAYSISSNDPNIAIEAGKSTYASEPPILATRNLGEGCIVIFATRSHNYIQQGYHMVFEGICLDQGDGYRLMVNIIDWLSVPSRISGDLGGYVEEKTEQEPQELLTNEFYDTVEDVYPYISKAASRPFREKITYEPHKTNDYVGIIGMYSSYSKGCGSVKEFCDEAKARGYDYVVFTEVFEDMDKEKWDKLVADCKTNSDEHFTAIAGLEIEDVWGQASIIFDIPNFPEEAWFDETGRRLKSHAAVYFLLNWIPKAFVDNTRNVAPPYHNKFYSCLEVYSYFRGNRFIGEILDCYLKCQGNEYNIVPISCHRLHAPQEMNQITGLKTHVLVDTLEAVPKEFAYSPSRWYSQRNIYLSGGPRIREFTLVNGKHGYRDELWKMYVDLASGIPIQEVIIYDGNEVFRRFLPNSTSFNTEIAGYHDKQHFFTLWACDAEGNEVLSSSRFVSDRRNSIYMCTDLQNTLNAFYHIDKHGNEMYFHSQGWQVTGLDGASPQLLYPTSELFPKSGIEYGAHGWAGNSTHRIISLEDGVEDGVGANHNMIFNSGDCLISDNVQNIKYPPCESRIKGMAVPTELADSVTRYISFTPRPYSINPMVVEHKTVFKQDMQFPNTEDLELRVLSVNYSTDSFLQYCVTNPQEEKRVGSMQALEAPLRGSLKRNGFIATYPNFWGSCGVFSLHCDLDFILEKDNFTLGYNWPNRLVQKGDSIQSDYIIIKGEFGESSEQEFESFYDVYGFDGTPAYSVTLEKGKILDQRFVLKLEAEDYTVKGSITKTNLPNDLGITVTGLCDNWDSGMLEVEDNNLRRVGTFEQTGYIAWNVNNRDRSFVIGNLVTCDDTDVRLSLIEEGGKYAVYAHNPKSKDITVTIKTAEWLSSIVPQFTRTVSLKAGKTLKLNIE